jgi:hypothetical protein
MAISRAGRSPAVVLCLVLVALLAAPAGPAGAATWTGRYSIWRNRAFTTQFLDSSCVGASVQIMLNLVRGKHDRSKRHQLAYLAYAEAHGIYPVKDGGADPEACHDKRSGGAST